MKDYASMSDREVNLTVAKLTNDDGDVTQASGKVFVHEYVNSDKSNGLCIGWKEFDPCNNPADAWPIILQNRISVIFDSSDESDESEESDEWVKACVGGEEYFISYHYCHRALRAAMVAFLMMKEGGK